MKKLLSNIAIACLALCSSTVFADSECHVIGSHVGNTYTGPTTCDHVTLSSITVLGPLMASATTIQGNATVSGPLNAKQSSTFSGTTTINGPITVEDTHFGGSGNTVNVHGPVTATNSTFSGTLEYWSNKSTLTGTTTKDVLVENQQTCPQQLYLNANTQVNGNIKFESGCGEVYLASGSHISGQVTGGKIIN